MKSKFFGSSKSKQPVDISPGYNSPNLGQRAPSPGYIHPADQVHSSQGQSGLSRSPSQRHIPIQTFAQAPGLVAGPAHAAANVPQGDERYSDHRHSAYLPPPLSPNPPQEKEKRGFFRDKLGIGHSSKQSVDQSHSASRSTGGGGSVGRTLSVKRKEPQNLQNPQNPEKYYTQPQVENRPNPNYPRGNSSQNLAPHGEEEEEAQHNAFIGQQQQQQQQYPAPAPPVPSKDQAYEPTYPQQQPPQAYYQDPRVLQRVNTDHSFHTQGSLEILSPSDQQHQGQQDPQLQQLTPEQYEAFRQSQEAAAAGQYPPTSAEDDEAGYSYPPQPQNQQYLQHGRQQSGQHPQPELHYPQPQQGRVSLDRYRPSSQPRDQPLHYNQPQTADSLFLQPPRGSSFENPPSPLQPAQPPPYDPQGATQPQAPPSPQPPSTADSQQSSQSNTMPQPQSRGNTIRQVEGKNMPPASREGSVLGQQGNSTLPPTPDLQTFGANVVPIGSQGQPYRGQNPLEGERGRETPPPPREMTEEDAAGYHQLQKDYKELRDKYQKVKKYYFEKESQVHQLQNTLAHQRLSQSRTSLDDSEYAARFSRLEGLISQLAFSIRKSWKTIPDFLHRGVNKDALATGKQEMTAVGRAYISNWIVQNLFETYFHPDLELGLSKDLREVWHNIRRFCPPFQSGEEEEALTAKIINWRLSTLEGLQDRLRSPEAAQHQQRLVDMLNEKLIADISSLLHDPAPPDLAGGVDMILELAIKIAIHVPLESRDVQIEYYQPLHHVLPEVMKIETGIPALMNPIIATEISPSSITSGGGAAVDSADRVSLKSTDTKESSVADDVGLQGKEEKRSRGMFSGLMSSGGSKVSKPPPSSSGAPPQQQQQAPQQGQGPPKQSGRETPTLQKEERVRMAVGISVQIRGRSVLVKAPVYGMGV